MDLPAADLRDDGHVLRRRRRPDRSGQDQTFAKDGNNQWADQDSAAARVLAEARKQGEAIPTAEKFATIASVLAGGEYPWTDIYQAYHRLLLYHEHTDGPDNAFDGAARTLSGSKPNRRRCGKWSTMPSSSPTGPARRLDRLAGLIASKPSRR